VECRFSNSTKRRNRGRFIACTIKFGVGDTFIIAGQSNARGFPEVFNDQGLIGYDINLNNSQLPDAVRVIGNAERPTNAPVYGTSTPNEVQTLKLGGLPVFKGFEKLTLQKELTADAAKIPNTDGTFSKLYDRPIFSLGLASWCWAPLGKKYVEQTGVPVQFFNVAVDGSSVNNWQPSSGNYNRLLSILQKQANILGHKGILWHQGEADASNNMTETDYQTKLKSLVDGIQNDFDSNGSTWGALTWNISNVSFYTKFNGSTYDIFPSTPAITNAQNSVSFQTSIKKNGVATDGIGANLRSPTQKIHFHAGTHGTVADLWKNLSLWTNTPKTAMPAMARTQITQQSNGTYNVKVLPDFPISEYRWVKNEDDVTIATTDTYNVPANSSTKDIFTCFVKPTGKNYWLIAPPFVGPNNEDRNPFIFVPVPPLAFSKQQEAKIFTLASKNMTWNSAVTDPSWVSIIQNSTGGHGNTEVKVQVTTNTGSSSRTNSIVFTGTSPTGQTMSQTLTIEQSATTGCTQT
jgi:Carbohydrate esterase, sialic acid-specific acetylesterase